MGESDGDDAMHMLQSSAGHMQHASDPRLDELPPCRPTPGGGCKGGFVNPLLSVAPAPPNHFPDEGCRWQSPKRIAVVHIGKTAGTSLLSMMSGLPLNFTHVHADWAYDFFDSEQFDLFVVPTREPVSRTVSAFNWRHPIGGGGYTFGLLSQGEKKLYGCFPELPGGVNRFAEALEEESECGLTARRALHSVDFKAPHMSKDTYWFVASSRIHPSVLATLRLPGRHALVVPTENFSAGTAALWDWLCVPRDLWPAEEHTNTWYERRDDTHLSPKGRANLELHTVRERYALEDLANLADKW